MLDLYRAIALIAIAALGYALTRRHARDPREPPAVGSDIPFIGHLLGLLKHGAGYFSIVAKKHPALPILSIDLILTKIYIVASPTLLQAVQRNTKTITFDPFVTFAAERVAGIKGPGLEALREKSAGGGGVNQAVVHAIHPTLTGKPLDRMNEKMVKLLTPLVDELAGKETVDLYGWCTKAITVASTEASYGPLNPYRDPKIVDAFWYVSLPCNIYIYTRGCADQDRAFEGNLSPLLAGFLPSIIARAAWQGRETAVPALVEYYNQGGHKQGSELTQARFQTQHEAGIAIEDIARLEVSMGIGLLANTVPACFWIVFDLYRRPELLAELRTEIAENAIRVADDGSNTNTHVIGIPALRDDCPLLVSTYQEILRARAASSPTRSVTEDTLLAEKYFLKKGSVVSIPSSAMSQHEDVWGASAKEFNPRRYLKVDASIAGTNNKAANPRRTGGFMTFGVSPVVCPGRHFASSEILAVVAMLILRFEFVPANPNAEWREPERNSKAISSAMGPVQGAFDVKVTVRDEYEGVKWDCEAKEGSGVFNLMV
ncbi:cytochrome P450 [Aspergillus crustosus]